MVRRGALECTTWMFRMYNMDTTTGLFGTKVAKQFNPEHEDMHMGDKWKDAETRSLGVVHRFLKTINQLVFKNHLTRSSKMQKGCFPH